MCRHPMIATSFSAMLLISMVSAADARPKQPSAAECEIYARNYASDFSRQGQLFGGAAFGGLAGFGIGSIWAASGYGAAIGVGVGLIGGIIAQASAAEDTYRVAYRDCMTRRVR